MKITVQAPLCVTASLTVEAPNEDAAIEIFEQAIAQFLAQSNTALELDDFPASAVEALGNAGVFRTVEDA